MRPVIWVCGPDRGGWPAWLCTALAVRRAGGRPVRVRPGRKAPKAPMHGLILGGGTDVSPDLYGGLRSIADDDRPARLRDRIVAWVVGLLRLLLGLKSLRSDPARDQLEMRLARRALDANVPTLGICRGMQLFNVLCGGDLLQDVATFYGEASHMRTLFPRRHVRLGPDSRLRALIGREDAWVNALHDQAVRTLGAGLRPAAKDERGLVQAIEHPDGFLVGVQWHPEYLPQMDAQRRLFEGLVAACRDAASGVGQAAPSRRASGRPRGPARPLHDTSP